VADVRSRAGATEGHRMPARGRSGWPAPCARGGPVRLLAHARWRSAGTADWSRTLGGLCRERPPRADGGPFRL